MEPNHRQRQHFYLISKNENSEKRNEEALTINIIGQNVVYIYLSCPKIIMLMSKKVFISSTFSDLAEYRLVVQNGIRQLGLEDISMENFGARDERPKDECLRIIKSESDYFVGIYAHRYGFIPKKDTISITQSEYKAAAKSNIPKLIYIIEDDFPFSPKYIDNGENKIRLQKFKDELFFKACL